MTWNVQYPAYDDLLFTLMPLTVVPRGAEWLISDSAPAILTLEQLDSDHRLVGQTAAEFVRQEVVPALDELEQKNWAVARKLLPSPCGSSLTPNCTPWRGSST